MFVHIPTPEEIEEERRLGEERRKRIERQNQLMREKIARTNEAARKRIEKDFRRRCRAVEARQEELKERGIRLTKNSPFHVDIYKQISGVAKTRIARQERRTDVAMKKKALEDMTGVPSNNPITKEYWKSLSDSPMDQNVLDARKHRETLRTLINEHKECERFSEDEINRIKAFFPVVAMEVEKKLNQGTVPRPEAEETRTMNTG